MSALHRSIAELRQALRPIRLNQTSIGCVPTLGGLHAGHEALFAKARAECGHVVATIFVNRLQFNQAGDFDSYPRDFEADLEICRRAGVDAVFAPEHDEMYSPAHSTFVETRSTTRGLCGAFRPGHFQGVTTVVAKLFNVVQPERAYFGEKDLQQLATIRRMTHELNFPIEIAAVPTVREPDGLALSSRNRFLSPPERRAATVLYRAIDAARASFAAGERRVATLQQAALAVLMSERLARPEYLSIVHPETIEPLAEAAAEGRLALAVWIGDTRLIDNDRLG